MKNKNIKKYTNKAKNVIIGISHFIVVLSIAFCVGLIYLRSDDVITKIFISPAALYASYMALTSFITKQEKK